MHCPRCTTRVVVPPTTASSRPAPNPIGHSGRTPSTAPISGSRIFTGKCGNCGARFRVKTRQDEKTVPCPKCNAEVRVTATTGENPYPRDGQVRAVELPEKVEPPREVLELPDDTPPREVLELPDDTTPEVEPPPPSRGAAANPSSEPATQSEEAQEASSKGCPKCGFSHGWDGSRCSHCKYCIADAVSLGGQPSPRPKTADPRPKTAEALGNVGCLAVLLVGFLAVVVAMTSEGPVRVRAIGFLLVVGGCFLVTVPSAEKNPYVRERDAMFFIPAGVACVLAGIVGVVAGEIPEWFTNRLEGWLNQLSHKAKS